jgi:hypothetical protein
MADRLAQSSNETDGWKQVVNQCHRHSPNLHDPGDIDQDKKSNLTIERLWRSRKYVESKEDKGHEHADDIGERDSFRECHHSLQGKAGQPVDRGGEAAERQEAQKLWRVNGKL